MNVADKIEVFFSIRIFPNHANGLLRKLSWGQHVREKNISNISYFWFPVMFLEPLARVTVLTQTRQGRTYVYANTHVRTT